MYWVVQENIRTPTTGGILEFRMHGGVLWPGIPNAQGGCWDWNSECMRGFLGLEFRRGGGGCKNSDLLTSEVRKTSLVCAGAEQTELQRYDHEVGMRSLFRIAMKRLLSTVVSVVFWVINSLLSTSAIHDTFLTIETVHKSCCSVLESPLNSN